jgi:ubiquinone/menaquinone biosynthesis C-methylase UbiE
MSSDYILGNDEEELARLKLQHELWKTDLIRLWKISKIKESARVLDLGCGPGFTTMDLTKYLGEVCDITSIDISENFLNYLNYQAKNLNNNQKITTKKSFIEELDLDYKEFDSAFCRWLMIFVQDPPKAIKRIHQHLRPKAQFILQEYVSYDSMDLVPHFKEMKPIVEAIFKSWKDQGGDPNRGKQLPQWLEQSGFKVTHLEPIAKFSRPDEPLWMWPESFYKSFLPRLEKSGYLTSDQVKKFFIEWESAKSTAGAYFIAPTVINIIAEKI